ncbi:hypothetical protein [Spirosoma soli]|uniref:hypothetical protein n=1 Tax=Spirosoma soli TaxID=1770529 RepID=UPI0036D3D4E6
MDLSPLLPPGFLFCNEKVAYDSLVIGLIATDAVGTCPLCLTPTNRVHSFTNEL